MDPEGGGGARGPYPLKNHKNIGFPSNTGPDPWKITRLPSQHLMLGHQRHASDGVSLAGLCWPPYGGIWILSPLINEPGRVAQSVTCLATDASLTADPGVASSIPARSHTFVKIDHEITSTVILIPSAESFKKGCCQLQAKVCARSTG